MAFVTYNAPEGDERVVTYLCVDFFDGIPVEVDADEHKRLLGKAAKNPFFTVSDTAEEVEAAVPVKNRGGRPRKTVE